MYPETKHGDILHSQNVHRKGKRYRQRASDRLCSKRSAWARAERWTRGERSRAHPQAAERRGNVAKKIAAAGAPAVVADGIGGVGAQPMTACFAKRIDALHGEAGQILHWFSLSGRKAQAFRIASVWRSQFRKKNRAPWRPYPVQRSHREQPEA